MAAELMERGWTCRHTWTCGLDNAEAYAEWRDVSSVIVGLERGVEAVLVAQATQRGISHALQHSDIQIAATIEPDPRLCGAFRGDRRYKLPSKEQILVPARVSHFPLYFSAALPAALVKMIQGRRCCAACGSETTRGNWHSHPKRVPRAKAHELA